MPNPLAPPEIVVHNLEQARGVLSVAEDIDCRVQLRSAPDAAAYAGVGFLHALGQAVGHDLVIDCHDDAGLVMAALRTGCRKIIFSGEAETHRRLVEMAEQLDAQVWLETETSVSQFSLSPEDDAERVRPWLCGLPNMPR